MTYKPITLPELLDRLEAHFGKQVPYWPTEPYEFLVWWHCGYPQSDECCARGWAALSSQVGIVPEVLLRAKPATLITALKDGGMVPELRAERLKQIAMRVQDGFGGDLRSALTRPQGLKPKPSKAIYGTTRSRALLQDNAAMTASNSVKEARKILKSFPSVADPGADRILLFARIAPIAAVPSNTVHVAVRVLHGRERENYGQNYKQAQQAIEETVPAKFDARQRAYLLLKRHGQELCKRTNPKCEACPVRGNCAYCAGNLRGRSVAARVPGSRR